MKYKIVLTLAIISTCFSAMAQGERKLNKNFSFVITGKLDTIASFSIEQRSKRSGWSEFNGALTQALLLNGFSVIGNDFISKYRFSLIIDYTRGFSAGKMQYSNLTGQIVNTTNKSEVIGTFTYDKRFEVDDISQAIVNALKSKNPIIVKFEAQKEESKSGQVHTSKEEKLKELKDLFEKELITKEEYERAKQKIIEE